MRKIDGDALKAIITSWIERTTHGEQTILSESIRETLRGVIEYINTLPASNPKDTPSPHAEWIDAFGDARDAKCPGCGSEMKAADFGREHFFFCYECGWGSPLCDTAEEALSAALRRAEPEMRPLTLDEILAKTNEEDWNFVWLEHKKSRTPMQLCPWNRERDKIIFCALPFDAQIAENIVEIRKTWRCWPRKPTPEQMAAKKWEE